jgi:CBS domain-containing protein
MIKNVEDIMTENVISVHPETPLPEAAMILSQHGFNGLPVVDVTGKLVGLFTERNMISDASYVHLKTLLKLFSELEFYKKDNSPIKADLKNLISIQVKDIMTPNPQTIRESESIEAAVAAFANPNNNPLPVVDQNNVLRGVISISDLTRLYGVATQKSNMNDKNMDQQIDQFVNKFEKQFLVVSRFRARTWLAASILFALIGFVIAMFWILRISI